MKKIAIGFFSCVALLTAIVESSAQPTTTKPDLSNTTTQCAVTKFILGGGVGASPVCSGLLTSGQILVGQAGTAPLPATVSGDATLNNAGALTLASTITAGGPTVSPIITYDAKGRLTAVTQAAAVTTQLLTTGTNATYTTPANVKWIEGFMRGGGAGGLGSGDTSAVTAPTAGGNTCWNTSGTACTSPLYQASGGGIPTRSATPAAGGTGAGIAGSLTCNNSATGGSGGSGMFAAVNSVGGFGGAAGDGTPGAPMTFGNGATVPTNSGAGGGGGGSNNTSIISGAGGGGGGYCRFIIANPAASYVYTIGAKGSGGALGTSGLPGGDGGSGNIFVIEHYTY